MVIHTRTFVRGMLVVLSMAVVAWLVALQFIGHAPVGAWYNLLFPVFLVLGSADMAFAAPPRFSRICYAVIVVCLGVLVLLAPFRPLAPSYWFGDKAAGPALVAAIVLLALLVVSVARDARPAE